MRLTSKLLSLILLPWLLVGSVGVRAAPAVQTITYQASDENFTNPERGAVLQVQPSGAANGLPENPVPLQDEGLKNYLRKQAAEHKTALVRVVYVLGQWTNQDIPQDFLNRIDQDFAAVRELSLKMVPYFAYSWPTDQTNGFDAPKDRVLRHLQQLTPILAKNKDVIALMYAGFIGPWGEWHHAGNNLLNDDGSTNQNTRAVLDGILAALPQDRMVALRNVEHKYEMYGTTPLSPSEAFGNSARARLGFHDECYMADYHPEVRKQRLANQAFLKQEGLYVPQIGMMDSDCFDFPNAVWKSVPCPDMIQELSTTRMDIVNLALDRIGSECVEEIKRRVGYRFRLTQANLPTQAQAGSSFTASVQMTNDGWGNLYNSRGLELVLRNKATSAVARLPVGQGDTRLVLPGPGETRTLTLTATLPVSLAAGSYDLLLNLPDPAPNLSTRPEYSVRLANQNTWEATTGYNKLNANVTIGGSSAPTPTPPAPGSARTLLPLVRR